MSFTKDCIPVTTTITILRSPTPCAVWSRWVISFTPSWTTMTRDRLASKLRNPEHLYSVYTLLYTLPGIPSIYYGSEWGMEGRRTREATICCVPASTSPMRASYHTDLTDYISRLGQIHENARTPHGTLPGTDLNQPSVLPLPATETTPALSPQ